jgi:hypothetical protein
MGPGGNEEAEPLGWFQKDQIERFAAQTPSLGQRLWGDWIGLEEAVAAFMEIDPDYVLHNAERIARRSLGLITEVTPEMREEVRAVTEDPKSGGYRWLERRKQNYWRGSMYSWGFAGASLTAIGYPDKTPKVCEELVPVVEDAFEIFKRKRPDLEPW